MDLNNNSSEVNVNNLTLYFQLLEFEMHGNCVPCQDDFNCTICLIDRKATEGVVIRECLHIFCKECLIQVIVQSNESEIKCPFIDANYSCNSLLQDREIRGILTKEEYDKYLMRCVRQAELKIQNTFHCKQPNCEWWCVFTDNVDKIRCEICKSVFCLKCQVSHEGYSCVQYKNYGANGTSSTDTFLKDMLVNKEAMTCPTCSAVVTKVSGCDALTCTMCYTQLCWATRGPRWGPKGVGDTSGGCQCNVYNKRCTPTCNNCH